MLKTQSPKEHVPSHTHNLQSPWSLSPPFWATRGASLKGPVDRGCKIQKSHHISNGMELNHLPKRTSHYFASWQTHREPKKGSLLNLCVFKTKPLQTPTTPFYAKHQLPYLVWSDWYINIVKLIDVCEKDRKMSSLSGIVDACWGF